MKVHALSCALAAALLGSPATAADAPARYGVGYGLSTPVFGLVLATRREESDIGYKLVSDFDQGVSLQLDYFGDGSPNSYWTAGVGRDKYASLIKGGVGYEKRFGALTLNGEFGLSLPVELDDEAVWGWFAYIWNLGLAVRVEF